MSGIQNFQRFFYNLFDRIIGDSESIASCHIAIPQFQQWIKGQECWHWLVFKKKPTTVFTTINHPSPIPKSWFNTLLVHFCTERTRSQVLPKPILLMIFSRIESLPFRMGLCLIELMCVGLDTSHDWCSILLLQLWVCKSPTGGLEIKISLFAKLHEIRSGYY